jgi:uncharacterized protein YdaU (DUF1376 family)
MEIELHYYTFNIGDYRRDTSHLTLLEHGIYRQLIDSYYLSEQPLCADEASLMRSHCVRSADEQQAFKNVLKDFFELHEDGWHHKGCEKIIDAYRVKSVKASASAKARWEKDANALPTHSERYANHKPITNNHKPITNIKTKAAGAAIGCPNEVNQQIWSDFLATRKAAKAPVTQTAIDGISREAHKAGWTLEQALQECSTRGWRGFKAEWVEGKKSITINKQELLEQRNQATVAKLLEKDNQIEHHG